MIEKTKLDSDESIISLDVKNLYINVPRSTQDAIDIALNNLYSQNEPPVSSRSTIKHLLNDGWAMATILAILVERLRKSSGYRSLKSLITWRIWTENNQNAIEGRLSEPRQWIVRIVDPRQLIGIIKIVVLFWMTITKAYQKMFGSANCEMRVSWR